MKHTCRFCKQECKQEPLNDDHFDYQDLPWFNCETCNVAYRKNLNIVEITRFYAELNGRQYCLDLIHKIQRTQILQLPDVDLLGSTVLNLPYMVPNITPTNCQSKIETYITFS